MKIEELRERPEMRNTVAHRIWQTWLEPAGLTVDHALRKQSEIESSETQFTLVAHTDGTFVGTISVIDSDLQERPDLTPWIAAFWVEPNYRHQHVGGQLMKAAEQRVWSMRCDNLYLCCVRELRPLYHRLGWTEIQEHVGKNNESVFMKRGPAV